MKRFLIYAAVAAIALFAFSTTLTAQDQPTKIVFVDSQAAIRAHPAGAEIAALEEQARAEIEALEADLQVLIDKANSGQELTAAERDQAATLQRTLQDVRARWTARINEVAAPAEEAVTQTIAAIAQENGYTIVLDRRVAASSSLVVYAQEGLDITQLVIERLQ